MNLFDSLVEAALSSQPSLSALRPVVEKEILHRDILREMSIAGLLDGLILYAESREEILADKIVALALRPNRVKNRDLWDILWLIQHGVVPNYALVSLKLADRHVSPIEFNHLFEDRIENLRSGFADYSFEIARFLPASASLEITARTGYWDVMLSVLQGILGDLLRSA